MRGLAGTLVFVGIVGAGLAFSAQTAPAHPPAKLTLEQERGVIEELMAFRKTLLEHQGLRWSLADVAIRLEAADALVHRATRAIQRGDPANGGEGWGGARMDAVQLQWDTGYDV